MKHTIAGEGLQMLAHVLHFYLSRKNGVEEKEHTHHSQNHELFCLRFYPIEFAIVLIFICKECKWLIVEITPLKPEIQAFLDGIRFDVGHHKSNFQRVLLVNTGECHALNALVSFFTRCPKNQEE